MKKLLSLILVAVMFVTVMPMAFAEGNTYKVGDIIQFGSYPQSEVKDETLIAELNALAPEWDDWTSYGYYTGTGSYGTMVQGDWMRYVDIKHDGERYRGVKFTQYRPYFTLYDSYSLYTNQDENGYSTNTVYWFKFESIDWRVLDPSTGLVMCETIIDSQPYSNTIYYNSGVSDSRYAYFNDAANTNYASDYETSSIRKWLNNDFYNTAFTDSEKKEISTTTLNNDGYYTSNGTTGYEKLDSNETKDKIFLLSYNEVRNSNFGFGSDQYDYDTACFGKGSDYAQSQGLYVYRSSGSTYNGNSYWLLRSPGYYSHRCCYVNIDGYSYSDYLCSVDNAYYGVRPALRFNRISDIGQSEHQHNYSAVVTNPTCTTQGYTTYACECGDTYVGDYVNAKGHSYTSQVTIPATHLIEGVKTYTCHCGDTYTESIPKLTEHTHNAVVTKPTCTTQGYTTYTCECGDSYVADYVGAKGHSHISDVTTPTCIAQGYTTYTCECDDTYVADYVDMLGHDMSEYLVTTNPTCSSKGTETSYCSRCDYTETKAISTLQHTYGDYISDGTATCTTDGLLIAKCDNCDATDSIPEKGGHSFRTDWTLDVEPTCTEFGSKSHHCNYCDEKTDVTPIAKLGHTYTSYVTDSTCTSNGLKVNICSCGDSYTETLPAKGHTFDGSVCTECDYDKADSCTCNCHKSGLSALLWKILNFFYRLLRLNPTCNCGIAHY